MRADGFFPWLGRAEHAGAEDCFCAEKSYVGRGREVERREKDIDKSTAKITLSSLLWYSGSNAVQHARLVRFPSLFLPLSMRACIADLSYRVDVTSGVQMGSGHGTYIIHAPDMGRRWAVCVAGTDEGRKGARAHKRRMGDGIVACSLRRALRRPSGNQHRGR